MGEAKDPRGDDHIEELLSQLQGIFGKLSHSEEEESQAKIDPPQVKPPAAEPAATPLPPAPVEPPDRSSAPASPEPEPAPAEPAGPPTVPDAPPKAIEIPEEPPPAAAPPPPPSAPNLAAVYCLVFYPPNRENEAKTLTGKVETMTPKFTKVEFHLTVSASVPYDPKGDPTETILPQVKEGIRAVFIVVDRPMDEQKRKTLAANLESRGIYLHEVPIISVEKKAFYTDLLLGMVFFYDSLKPAGE